jgi:hypothetical protein
MTILVTGSGGLLGRALCPALTADGHDVLRLVRRPPLMPDERQWNPTAAGLAPDALDGVEAVVHLAGAGVADKRWSPSRKAQIRDSRVRGTALLAEGLAAAGTPPESLICASAIGWYGDRGDELLDEGSEPGSGFLADVCRDWERAAEPARSAGVRVVHLRLGMVLAGHGGALAKMLTPFRMGLGGVLGSGRQWISWITVEDVVGVIRAALAEEGLEGPVNAVTPGAVTNAEFTKALGRVVKRPAVLPMPAFAARLAFGEVADALLLSSARVTPRVLQERGHAFAHPELESALRQLLA